MGSIKQFGLDATAIEEWLPWGGIVRPSVMKQKDGSMFSIIEYEPYSYRYDGVYKSWSLRRGWSLWRETQHDGKVSKHYLVICWNPFLSGGKAQNALTPDIKADKAIDYFEAFVKEDFLPELQKLTKAKTLEYQEIMDVLSFSLSHGDNRQKMPDTPLYMDALLSQDVDLKFGANDVYINGKRLYIVSLQAPWNMDSLYSKIKNMPYRRTRRLVMFGKKESLRTLKHYTESWFPGRKAVRLMALDGILSVYNGYYTDSFQFLLGKEDNKAFPIYFEKLVDAFGVNYIVQKYRLKETFWGSIPGLFLADTRPPIIGFTSISDFLGAEPIVEEKKEDILGNAKRNLTPTTVKVEDYFGGKDVQTR